MPKEDTAADPATQEIKMRPPWHREACWECGDVCLATRTKPRPSIEPHFCEPCEAIFDREPSL